MQNNAIKVCLIGLGQIAHGYASDPKRKGIVTHTQAYLQDKHFQLLGGFDPKIKQRNIFNKRWGIASFDNLHTMLETTQPTVVSVCSPPQFHLKNIKEILKYPSVKIIFCEKPLAHTYKEAIQIKKELSKRKDVSLFVNFSRRYDQAHQRVARLIKQGQLGKIQMMNAYYGGSFESNVPHLIDLILWYGGEIKKTQIIKNAGSGLHVILTLKNGILVFIHPLNKKHYLQFELHLFGTKKKISIIQNGFMIEESNIINSPYFTGIKTLENGKKIKAYQNVFENALDKIYQKLQSKKTGHHLLDESMNNQKIMEKIQK